LNTGAGVRWGIGLDPDFELVAVTVAVGYAPLDMVVRGLSARGSDVATAIGEIANTANSEREA